MAGQWVHCRSHVSVQIDPFRYGRFARNDFLRPSRRHSYADIDGARPYEKIFMRGAAACFRKRNQLLRREKGPEALSGRAAGRR